MTDLEIAELGPEFGRYLRRYRGCFLQDRTAGHFDTYCSALSVPHGPEPSGYVVASQPLTDCFQSQPVADLPVDLRQRDAAAVRARGKKPAAPGRAAAASTGT